MALVTPGSWTQNGTYTALSDRLTAQGIVSGSGVIGASSLAVTAQGSPNNTVNIAAGWGAYLRTSNGVYQFYNDATIVQTIAANASGNPRIDRISITVNDSYLGDANNTVSLTYTQGTPAASPVAPATPANSISLATIAVANGFSTITSGNITDTRTIATSNLVTGNALPLTGGTMTGAEVLAAGTTTLAPLKFQAGSTLTSVAGGSVEYDGAAAYLTPNSSATSGRGSVPAGHYYEVIGTQPTIANTGAAYLSLFGVGLTVAASTTYEFEINATVSGLGSTSRTVNFNLLGNGTATLQTNGGGYLAITNSSASMAANNSVYFTTPGSDLQIASGSTSTIYNISVRGLIRVNASGSINPAIKFSVATGTAGVTVAGSYVRFTPVTGTGSFLTGGNLALGAWA